MKDFQCRQISFEIRGNCLILTGVETKIAKQFTGKTYFKVVLDFIEQIVSDASTKFGNFHHQPCGLPLTLTLFWACKHSFGHFQSLIRFIGRKFVLKRKRNEANQMER